MPEQIKSLIFILFLAAPVFYFLRIPANKIIGARTFNRRRNLWFGITLFAFLSPNYWIFIFSSWLLLHFLGRSDKNKVSLFLFLLFTVPGGGVEIPGFGLLNYFFALNHQRFLVLALLLPVFLKLLSSGKKYRSRNNAIDTLVICYVILCALLQSRGTSFTDALRGGFYLAIDIYLPYFVVSRTLSSTDDFKDTFFSYVSVILVLSVLGVFEFVKQWHIYDIVTENLGLTDPSGYLRREGYLRAYVTLQVIPLGYVISIGLGAHLYLFNLYSNRGRFYLILGAIIAGLISPLSRGPWVGAAVLISAYFFFSKNKLRKLPLLVAGFVVCVVVAGFTPLGNTLMGLIPFVGDVESGNITYRQQILTNSWIVIQRNPLLGSADYLLQPEMEALRQGQGIIDIVNTYASTALKYGLVGLALFAGSFFVAGLKVFSGFTRTTQLDEADKNLGKILLAILLCIIVTIGTVSPISAIPIMYWIVLGMCSAYTRMIENNKREMRRKLVESNSLSSRA